ncbi:MAG: histidinol-phosphate transaminase [Cellvibrionales bacterium TMED47]|nr:histidinol-phosphate transaminase [Porticoccaceae bacterium]RPG84490.1 MAG: histidinol-phosphate transaminase [Cellvibrionales bacterium TMED47]
MSSYWSDFVKDLDPYSPGEQPQISNITKLNTNENPYGPSPAVITAISEAADDRLRLYPPPEADQLKCKIAEYFQLSATQIFVGNGSDEVLAHIFNGLLSHPEKGPLLFPDISYSFYPVFCQLYGIHYEKIPLADDFSIDLDDFQRANGGIIFPNPNAPTGLLLGLDAIESVLQKNIDTVVVVDEAYIDFGGQTAASLIDQYDNLLVVQTMSKSRCLAGMRVGYAMGSEHLIEGLNRIKNSFNSYPLGHLQIAAAIAAFDDTQYFENTRQKVISERERVVDKLQSLGFEVLPSKSNFVLVRHPQNKADLLAQSLREKGIIVRYFAMPRIDQFLRITIGTDAQNTLLIECLKQIL